MDAWGAGAAGTDSQREEDEHSERASRSDSIFWDIHSDRTTVRGTGREYIGYSPSKKSVARIKEKVGDLLEGGQGGAMGRGTASG